jgi:hypothetical protein
MEVKWYPKGLVPIDRNVEIVKRLAAWRRTFELEAEGGMQTVEVNAALFLSDICMALGLNEADQRKVLGKSASTYAMAFTNATVMLVAEAEPRSAKQPPVPAIGRIAGQRP